MNSEFQTVTSNDTDEYVAFDLQGARQVVLQLDRSAMGELGYITNEPFTGSMRFPIYNDMATPLVVNSNDGRLYFVAASANTTTLFVWVIR